MVSHFAGYLMSLWMLLCVTPWIRHGSCRSFSQERVHWNEEQGCAGAGQQGTRRTIQASVPRVSSAAVTPSFITVISDGSVYSLTLNSPHPVLSQVFTAGPRSAIDASSQVLISAPRVWSPLAGRPTGGGSLRVVAGVGIGIGCRACV